MLAQLDAASLSVGRLARTRGYSLDWSGRLVETMVYESAAELAADTPDSIEQTTWQPLTLFCPNNAQAQPDELRYYVCGELSFRIENRDTAKRVVHGQLGHFLGAFTANAQALDVAFVYGPFGEILAQSGPDPADYTHRFNGKEQDQLTILSYYGARYFDPLSLSWTQADPLYRFAPDMAWDQPRRANLYSFTLNNPLRYLDPDGKSPLECEGTSSCASGGDHDQTVYNSQQPYYRDDLNDAVHFAATLGSFAPGWVGRVSAGLAAATDESEPGPPVDLANVDPSSLPGPPGGPGGVAKPPGGKPGAASGKTSLIDRKAFAKERAAYWKNEAKNNPGKYSKEDLAKMQKGQAPTGPDGHPMELHHKDQKPDEVQPKSRTEHRLGENYKKNHPPQKKE
jgi:RHS repeat-associated protein